jgi:tetratricopeptide (TPR) repeat protein
MDSLLGIGYCYFALEDYESAADGFSRIIDIDVEGYYALEASYGLGRCLTELYQPGEAIEYYEAVLAIDPTDESAWIFVLLENFRLANYEEMLERSEEYFESNAEMASIYALRAIAAYMTDQTSIMEEALEKAVALQGEDAYDVYYTTSALSMVDRFSEAEAILLEARQDFPEEEVILNSLIGTRVAQKKFDVALADIEESRDIFGETKDLLLALASVKIEQGDFDAAEAALNNAFAIAPNDWEVHNDLAYLYLQQGRYAEAEIEASIGLDVNPYSSALHKNLALAAYEVGNPERAMRAALESVRLHPQYDMGHYALGLCYMQQGETDSAITAFETFLELYWDRNSGQQYKDAAEEYLRQLR